MTNSISQNFVQQEQYSQRNIHKLVIGKGNSCRVGQHRTPKWGNFCIKGRSNFIRGSSSKAVIGETALRQVTEYIKGNCGHAYLAFSTHFKRCYARSLIQLRSTEGGKSVASISLLNKSSFHLLPSEPRITCHFTTTLRCTGVSSFWWLWRETTSSRETLSFQEADGRGGWTIPLGILQRVVPWTCRNNFHPWWRNYQSKV